jgi:cytochrome c oxidase subunit 1
MLRRMSDGGASYSALKAGNVAGTLSPFIIGLNNFILWGAVGLGLAQIPFIINFFYSIRNGELVNSDNPWQATTLEWQTPTPPPHGNFLRPPQVYRGPYEYSVPGRQEDYVPQNQPD